MLGGAICHDIHQGAAVAQSIHICWCNEGGAGIVGFKPHRAIQFGRVTNRFVDGQPQVRRVKDQRVVTWLHRFGKATLSEPVGQLGKFRCPVPSPRTAHADAVTGQVLPASGHRGRAGTHGLE